MPDETKRRRRIARPSVASIIVLVTLLLGIAVLAPTVQQLVVQRQRIADLQASIEATEAEIIELQAQEARWNDPAFIEAQARGRLLFVKPGETTYLVVDSPGGAPQVAPAAATTDMHETDHDWVSLLAQSFVASGSANAAPAAPDDPALPPLPSAPAAPPSSAPASPAPTTGPPIPASPGPDSPAPASPPPAEPTPAEPTPGATP